MKDADSHGYIVHHKSYIDISNIYDTNITLNFNNLELLCIDCHNKEHFAENIFDADGNIKAQDNDVLKLCGVYKK